MPYNDGQGLMMSNMPSHRKRSNDEEEDNPIPRVLTRRVYSRGLKSHVTPASLWAAPLQRFQV